MSSARRWSSAASGGGRRRHLAVLLKAASGKICQICDSRRTTSGYDQRVKVRGGRGVMRVENLHGSTVAGADVHRSRGAPVLNLFLERYTPAYRRELEHFLVACSPAAARTPSGEDGSWVKMLADAATRAHASGQPQAV